MRNIKEFESIYFRYESSGLKVRDFCANEVINEAKFYYWQKKFRELNLPIQSFVPIVVDSKSPSSRLSCTTNAGPAHSVIAPPEYEIFYPCGTTLRVKGTVNAELLKTLIQLTR